MKHIKSVKKGRPAGKRLVYGFGINDAGYSVHEGHLVDGKWKKTWICPFYTTWAHMLQRCYSVPFQKQYPTYVESKTIQDWHLFSTFRSWMDKQDWQSKVLDKDILFPGNKVYGPDTCVFVSQEVNKFIGERTAARGDWPIGVYLNRDNGKFVAQCRSVETGRSHYLGQFFTPKEAHDAWLDFKLSQAVFLASKQDDVRVAQALISRYSNYKEVV